MQPELILNAEADLGEGPAWDDIGRKLYWVDIRVGRLHRFDPDAGTDEFFCLDEPVGCVAPCKPTRKSPGGLSGSVVLALKSGLVIYNPSSKEREYLARPESHLPGNRFNDGKCDPAGRFLAGTMDNGEKEVSGSLYTYSPEGRLKTLLKGIRISNGLTWSPDSRTFFFIDTPTRQVTAYDYDLATGDISNPRAAVKVPPDLGWPDGMTMDSEGMIWVAMWGGAKLTRWDPSNGKLLEAIPFPALNVTACAFGGHELNELFVTSARKDMSEKQLADYPLSGGLFRIRTNTKGLPTFAFGA
jgi:sugar lactone lactonase YvrE